ncbi:MAG: sugar ABC transporter substrate-binding protein, partial [Chloroflexi bacterium]|nr:sugar ABC transporter substrate-binding protein [Chloroflexota bacterium]
MQRISDLARLAAAAALVFSVACSSNGASSGTTSSSSSGSNATTGNVTLSVWAMGDEGDKLGNSDVIQQFQQANPNIKVNVTAIPWNVAHDKLITAVAGKQTPDVTQLGTTWAGEFSKLNAMDDVPGAINQNDFYKAAIDAGSYNGKLVGVPWYVDTRVLYYRTDLAQQAGIAGSPQTWDDLNKLAQAYHGAGAKYGIALSSNNWEEYVPFLYSAGGDIMQNGQFTLDSDAAVKALTEYVTFFQQNLTPQTEPQGFDVTQTFVSGDTPMFFSGPWHRSLIQKAAPNLEGNWATAMVPKDQSSTSFVGGAEFAVFKNSPNRDAAWKFVQYMTQPATQVAWYKDINDLPAVKSAWDDQTISSDQSLKVFGDQLNSSKAPPSIPQWEEIANQLNDWLQKACLGQVSPQDAAKGMQQAATSIYKP